jgi:hypothetical protein
MTSGVSFDSCESTDAGGADPRGLSYESHRPIVREIGEISSDSPIFPATFALRSNFRFISTEPTPRRRR